MRLSRIVVFNIATRDLCSNEQTRLLFSIIVGNENYLNFRRVIYCFILFVIFSQYLLNFILLIVTFLNDVGPVSMNE